MPYIDPHRHPRQQSIMAKLYIPAPQEENDHRVFLECIGVSFAICTVLLFVFSTQVLMFHDTRQAQAKAKAPKEPIPQVKHIQSIAKKLDKVDWATHTWSFEDLEAVFLYGPKNLSELACESWLEEGKPTATPLTEEQTLKLELLLAGQIKRQMSFAPTACFLRIYTRGKLRKKPELEVAGKLYWDALLSYDLVAEDLSADLERYRKTSKWPIKQEYFDWLRDCSMRYGLINWYDCVISLRAISPKEGEDFMDMLEHHARKDPMIKREAIELYANTLATIVEKGYPPAWQPLQVRQYPEFMRDAQVTAVLQLCRMLNSPNKDAVELAASSLSAGIGYEAKPRTAVARWRETCQLAFIGKGQGPKTTQAQEDMGAQAAADMADDAQAFPPKNLLAVWSGDPDDLPDYTLAWSIKQGYCQDGLKPRWRCVGALWKHGDEVRQAMRDLFIKTRYIDWGDQWEDQPITYMARPEKTIPIKMLTPEELINQGDQGPDLGAAQPPQPSAELQPD